MSASRLRSLLLLLALLAGQWLTLAHGFEHSALQADVECTLCVQARAIGAGAPSSTATALRFEPAHVAPASTAVLALRPGAAVVYRSRAPPSLLV